MQRVFPLRYWNSAGIAVAIVATATYFHGELYDWTAYIGGTTETQHEQDAYDVVAQVGEKLDRDLAVFIAKQAGYIELTKKKFRQ